jgi:hypothetical protein
MIVSLVGWLIFSYVFMSLAEYALHRWPMHSKAFATRFRPAWPAFERHARLHHGRFYREFAHDPDPVAKYVNIDLDPGFSLLASAPVWGLLYVAGCTTGAAVFAGFVVAHALVWSAVHREMHEPEGRWFSGTRLYRFWRSYHKTHHDHPSANFNVVLPGADHLFGTYRGHRGSDRKA